MASNDQQDVSHDHQPSTIHDAAKWGNVEAVEAFARLDNRALDSANEYGWTAMHFAAHNGHQHVIETLVRLGSKAIDAIARDATEYRRENRPSDAPRSDGMTPMHAAAEQGHVNAIETLVRLGSRAKYIPDSQRITPMYLAAHDRGDGLVLKTLKAVDHAQNGGGFPMFKAGLTEGQLDQLRAPVDPDEVAKIRYRVYFAYSLAYYLLFALSPAGG